MNTPLDPSLSRLNDCGCCQGTSAKVPVLVTNRPGLKAIVYRAGTHGQFKQSLLARLSSADYPALRALTTREDDDFSIALLDAWSTVADVLTFYQERIANENYLRTATERRSLLELARLIGYQLQPGVAASTCLAFTIEEARGGFGQAINLTKIGSDLPQTASPPVTIGVGVKVQSIPGPGETAQTFETVEEIEARAAWNAIKPRMQQLQNIRKDAKFVILDGTALNLSAGDMVLLVDSAGARQVRKVRSVTTDDEAATTRLDFEATPPDLPAYDRPELDLGSIEDFAETVELDETVVEGLMAKSWKTDDLAALAEIQGWSEDELSASLNEQIAQAAGSGDVFVFRARAALFGHNAPKQPTYTNGTPDPPSQWDEWEPTGEASDKLFLDAAYEGVLPESYVGVQKSGSDESQIEIHPVKSAAIRPRTEYGLSSKTTEVTLDSAWWDPTAVAIRETGTIGRISEMSGFEVVRKKAAPRAVAATVVSAVIRETAFPVIRETTVHAESEALPLARLPIEDEIQGDTITLDGAYLGLQPGRKVILTGERSDLEGVVASETLTLKEVLIEGGFTVLEFEKSLAYIYVRESVSLNANVSEATHGETVEEILGSGDASQPFQKFTLRQPPLTYVSAANATGAETTLEIRVNSLLWEEVTDLYGHGPDERIYMTRRSDDGKTTVMFGDGKTGARLPTGSDNIKAKYRKGIGVGGILDADQLSQLMTRPLGVKAATNPLATAGAADAESRDAARENAPLTILTLGRIVSLQDYQDFARAFAGIDKALATWTWDGEKRGVFVTIAGTDGATVETDGELYGNLLEAMREAGDPRVPLEVQPYSARLFRLAATLEIESEYLEADVLAEVEAALRAAYAFDARDFGQPVTGSEIIAVIQNVEGVKAANLTRLYRSGDAPAPNTYLAAAAPQPGAEEVFPAELLTLDPQPLDLEVLKRD